MRTTRICLCVHRTAPHRNVMVCAHHCTACAVLSVHITLLSVKLTLHCTVPARHMYFPSIWPCTALSALHCTVHQAGMSCMCTSLYCLSSWVLVCSSLYCLSSWPCIAPSLPCKITVLFVKLAVLSVQCTIRQTGPVLYCLCISLYCPRISLYCPFISFTVHSYHCIVRSYHFTVLQTGHTLYCPCTSLYCLSSWPFTVYCTVRAYCCTVHQAGCNVCAHHCTVQQAGLVILYCPSSWPCTILSCTSVYCPAHQCTVLHITVLSCKSLYCPRHGRERYF